jgi:hypothetical protein
VAWGRTGVGPLASLLGPSAASSPDGEDLALASASANPVAEAPTTSTTIYTLTRRNYRAGDCILWNQQPGTGERSTKTVDCAEPHLLEFTAFARVPERLTYPSDDEWAMLVREKCLPLAEKHLGYPLVPGGRFDADALQPTHQSWLGGDRELTCGIGYVGWKELGFDPTMSSKFTGVVQGQDQALLYSVGTCLAQDEAGDIRPPVPCTELHAFEITGHVDLSGKITDPADETAVSQVAGPACDRLAEAYLGRRLRGDLGTSWFNVRPETWAAGVHRLECTVSRYRDQVAQHVTGSLSALQTS